MSSSSIHLPYLSLGQWEKAKELRDWINSVNNPDFQSQCKNDEVQDLFRIIVDAAEKSLWETPAEDENTPVIESYTKVRKNIFAEVEVERHRQDGQWGQGVDDLNGLRDWAAYIQRQLTLLFLDPRKRFINIAALAIAAVESFDRFKSSWGQK